MFNLIKLSAPGWEKNYTSEYDCRLELYSHICNICRAGDPDIEFPQDPVNENSTMDEMLSTPCGCEYMVEGLEDDERTKN